jgi:hypothetical protein
VIPILFGTPSPIMLWNHIQQYFLQQTCADFHKLDKSQISKQFSIITDEINEMFDEDEDVTPLDDDGIHLPNQTVHLDNDEYNDDEECVSITEDILDPNNLTLETTMTLFMLQFNRNLHVYLDQSGTW